MLELTERLQSAHYIVGINRGLLAQILYRDVLALVVVQVFQNHALPVAAVRD